MMNPTYHFARMRELLDEFEPSRERSLAQTKLDEAELWLTRCAPTAEALQRDGVAHLARPTTDGGAAVMLADEIRRAPARPAFPTVADLGGEKFGDYPSESGL